MTYAYEYNKSLGQQQLNLAVLTVRLVGYISAVTLDWFSRYAVCKVV